MSALWIRARHRFVPELMGGTGMSCVPSTRILMGKCRQLLRSEVRTPPGSSTSVGIDRKGWPESSGAGGRICRNAHD